MREPRTRRRQATAGAALLLLGLATPALAHKLRVFATAEGDLITGSAYFAGGGAATGARLSIRDAAGRTLAELTPDAEGRFSYRAAAPMDLVVVAETGDGHRAEWPIPASDLAGAFAGAAPATGGPSGAGLAGSEPAPGGPAAVVPAPDAAPDATEARLEAAIERALARQVRPLREELQAAQDRARFTDILGGIGYLVGLAGLGLWWQARRRDRAP